MTDRMRFEPYFLALVFIHAGTASAPAQDPQSSVRDVMPPGIIRVYGAPDGRESGRAGMASSPQRRFERLRVTPDGTIRSPEETIVLYGIEFPAHDKICVTSTGARWACGKSAIGAARAMLHDRSIACLVREQGENGKIVGACRIGQIDIAYQLLERGWASLAEGVEDKRLIEAAEAGKSKRLGLWANGPPSVR